MKNPRFVYLFLFCVLGSQYAAVLFGFDIWPLSSYPMFAELQTIEMLRAFRVDAVTKEGETIRLPYSNWPGWWNYIEFYLSEKIQLDRLKQQMIFDWRQAVVKDPRLNAISELRLIDSYATGDLEQPLLKHRAVVTLNPQSGEIKLVPTD